jgi:hypothetical protein
MSWPGMARTLRQEAAAAHSSSATCGRALMGFYGLAAGPGKMGRWSGSGPWAQPRKDRFSYFP